MPFPAQAKAIWPQLELPENRSPAVAQMSRSHDLMNSPVFLVSDCQGQSRQSKKMDPLYFKFTKPAASFLPRLAPMNVPTSTGQTYHLPIYSLSSLVVYLGNSGGFLLI